jgi:hypothetical protein
LSLLGHHYAESRKNGPEAANRIVMNAHLLVFNVRTVVGQCPSFD